MFDSDLSTLPMSLVCIFSAIAKRLGLRTSIIGFPQRILCRIGGWRGQDASSSRQYVVDIFAGGNALPDTELNARLGAIGIPPSSLGNFVHDASPVELVARVSRNIITSLQHNEFGASSNTESTRSAHAAIAALLFLQPNNLLDALPNMLHQFPLDVYSIERDYVPVLLRETDDGLLMASRLRRIEREILERDATDVLPRLRQQQRKVDEGDIQDIIHHIGTVFRHRKWGYVAVIRRWDPRCSADEVWMQANHIDDLEGGGRRQPFYAISADDGSEPLRCSDQRDTNADQRQRIQFGI